MNAINTQKSTLHTFGSQIWQCLFPFLPQMWNEVENIYGSHIAGSSSTVASLADKASKLQLLPGCHVQTAHCCS